MKLRPYQEDLVSRARSAFAEGHRRVLIQLPTGGGKTAILAEIVRSAMLKRSKALAMVHRIEIVHQISATLTGFGLSPEICAAGIRTSDQPTNCIVAMQQTLVRRLSSVEQPSLLIVDEAHHQTAAGYQKISDYWPDTPIIGLTATPTRLDGRPLKLAFDVLILGPTVRELIDMGYLAEFTYLAPPVPPELIEGMGRVKKVGGDYSKKDLEAVVKTKKIIGDMIVHYTKYLNGKTAIAFCVNVAHGDQVAEDFRAAGFRAESVHGGMKKDERDGIIDRFRSGQTSVLVSCDLIGEGFDVPDCAGVLLMRPTASLSIFLQQVGRALRPKADGSRAIILDHVGNCHKHGQPDDMREWTLDGKLPKNKVKMSQCEKCWMVINPVTLDKSKGCPSGVYPKLGECPVVLPAGESSEPPLIELIDGKLVEFKRPVLLDWAGGIDVKHATGREYSRLLRAAGKDRERLGEIARIRNFKRSWVDVRLRQIEEYDKRWRKK